MTDRINYLTVALAKDMRDDDVQHLTNAIQMIKGVLAVEPHVAETSDWLAEERARHELRQKIMTLLYPEKSLKGGANLG